MYIMCFDGSVHRSSSIMPYLFFMCLLVLLECGIDYNVQCILLIILHRLRTEDGCEYSFSFKKKNMLLTVTLLCLYI